MIKVLYQSFMATLILALLTCGAYPLVVTGIGQLLFRSQALGSIVMDSSGKPLGSRLIGQGFSRPEYFHPRPSAAGDKGYDASNSSGSNLGPTNPKLAESLKANAETYLKENPQAKRGEIPVDAITASASGLDPEISPENALLQAERVAQARSILPDEVRTLVKVHTSGPQLGIFGEPTVNVLELNLDLDRKFPLRR